jgi:hypothetical protein
MTPSLYKGICTTNADPERRMRIKLMVPQLLGKQESTWALPCVPPGWGGGLFETHADPDGAHAHTHLQKVPRPGQGVWVMFEAGDIEKPVWLGVWQ